MFVWLASVWDSVELWLTQLPFAFQFAIVMVVLVPVCLGIAWAIDRLVDLLAPYLIRWRRPEQPVHADLPPRGERGADS